MPQLHPLRQIRQPSRETLQRTLEPEIELKIAVHDKWIREAEKVAEVDLDEDQYKVPLQGAGGILVPRH